MGEPVPHVLIITLGPIQDFIASARKARDLWFGSWLLSELSRAVAVSIATRCGPASLVFPGGPDVWSDQISVANKIIARLPDTAGPADVARQAQKALEQRLEELYRDAFDHIKETAWFNREMAERQVRDLIEFSWVSVAEEGTDGYAKARRQAEDLLAARKNTRLWGSVPWGLPVPKSSLDGERESVLHEELFDQIQKKTLCPEDLRKKYGVGKAERLCGVGLLKRHGRRKGSRYSHRFVSTGHIAAWPVLKRMAGLADRAGLQEAWDAYVAELERLKVDLPDLTIFEDGVGRPVTGRFDGSILFENRLPDLFEHIVAKTRQEEARLRKEPVAQARKALQPVLDLAEVKTPLPYYAILMADGDHMGKAIRAQKDACDHQRLSIALDAFARNARSIVEGTYDGELIYAGGDDVLAFVPLYCAVECARHLAQDFKEKLAKFPIDQDGATPTLSAGIGISHFLEPMGHALKVARDAEKLAKVKRGSLAVILDKRSGSPVEVSGLWGDLDTELLALIDMHRLDLVPDRAAYELQELALLTRGPSPESPSPLRSLAHAEAKRILARKQPGHGVEKRIKEKILETLHASLDRLSPEALGNRLAVARLLAQAQDQAGLPLPIEAETDQEAKSA
jgi:CRISPR-associated protein Cmr2